MGEHLKGPDRASAGARFSVATSACDAETIGVAVRGDVDLVTGPELEQELLEAAQLGAPRIVVDLNETTFFDSSAIHALVQGGERLVASGRQFGIVCSNPTIRNVLEIVGLDQTFPIHATMDEVIGSTASSQFLPVLGPAGSYA